MANKRHPPKKIIAEQNSRCPQPGRASLLPCSQSPPPPQPGPAWDTRCSGPERGARPGVASPGPPKPHVPAGRALEPAPARPLGRGQPASGSCQPWSAPPRLPTVPSARPATARILLNPAAPAAPRGLLPVPGPPEPQAPKPWARPHSLRGGGGGPAGRRRRSGSWSARTSELAPSGGGNGGGSNGGGNGGGGGRADDWARARSCGSCRPAQAAPS